MTGHLDDKRLTALLDGTLGTEQERELAEHLRQDCRECDDFLASLDEDTERRLLAILARVEAAPDLSPAAQEMVLERRKARFFGLPPLLVPVAGLALLLLVGLAVVLGHALVTDEGSRERIKGTEVAPAVELTFGRVETTSGSNQVVRVASGDELSTADRLVFELRTAGPCFLYLVRVDAQGVHVLLPAAGQAPLHHAGGDYVPSADGRPLGISLAGLSGAQRFVAVCAMEPLALPDGLRPLMKRSKEAPAARQRHEVISLNEVEIVVKDGESER